MIRKYTHHLMSCKGMSENFEMNLFCSKIKKVWVVFGICVEIASRNTAWANIIARKLTHWGVTPNQISMMNRASAKRSGISL